MGEIELGTSVPETWRVWALPCAPHAGKFTCWLNHLWFWDTV